MRSQSLLLVALAVPLAAQEPYRRPPEAIAACIEAEPPPGVSLSPAREHLLLAWSEPMPSIATLARPVLGLAGRRIDPSTRGPQRTSRTKAFTLVSVADGTQRGLPLPKDANLGGVTWSADGKHFAFTNTTDDRIELWVCDLIDAQPRRLDGVRLNATLGTPVRWMPDQKTLLCLLDPESGPAPERPRAPAGPVVDEAKGGKAPVRTYQDLLRDEHDAKLFEHYMTSQLAVVDPANGKVEKLGAPGLVTSADFSPDGRFALVTVLHRPFSYLVNSGAFPKTVAVWTRAGKPLRTLVDQPLQDKVPIGGVPTGPRAIGWHPHFDATLTWVEAQDGGDPKAKVEHRDRLVTSTEPFDGTPVEVLRLKHRFAGAQFGSDAESMLVSETDRDRKWATTWLVRGNESRVLFDRSQQDAYGDPGRAVTRQNPRGDSLVQIQDGAVWLDGEGATPDGARPFLDRYELASGKKTRVFACREGVHEQVLALLADDGSRLLVREESPTSPPRWQSLDTKTGRRRDLVTATDPSAERMRGIKKQLLKYTRKDGVALSATLYLPPDLKEGEKRPMLVWAYPREFNTQDTAGQVRGSPYRYTRLAGTSHLLLLLAGYVVLDDAAMPVVGHPDTANDTFIPQVVASAEAAIDAVDKLGMIDRSRVAVGGHSYGAFMTANLLAHCDLFRTGIARSGAYNRTLTPFSFQSEERTLWQARDVYLNVSPFLHADQINEPILLIHGEADNNPGTFPMQSQRLFAAIKGNGGRARLVMLPYESHGYAARESVLHVMAEMVEWLDRHLQDGKRAPAATDAELRR